MTAHSSRASLGSVWLAVALSWLGLVVCLLLLQASSPGGLRICPVQSGCDAVLSSRFSSIRGFPLSWLGVAFYTVMLIMCLVVLGMTSSRRRAWIISACLYASVAGVSFTVGLMYLQFCVIRAFCPLCTASAAIQIMLLGALIFVSRADVGDLPSSLGASVVLLVFALSGGLSIAWPVFATRQVLVDQIGDKKWFRAQMDRELRAQVWPLNRQISELESEWAQKKIDGEVIALEARKRRMTVENLLAEFGEDRERRIDKLRAEYSAKNLLSSMSRGPIAIPYDARQATGPDNADIEVVVFSDFTCRFCIDLDLEMRRIRNEFPQIRIVHRDFPLRLEGAGFVAAVAGKCAAEQGRFWEYHDRLFDEKGQLPTSKLITIARQMQLDEARFSQCLASDDANGLIRKSYDDAVNLGIPGAPAVFVDGVPVAGVIDYVVLRGIILNALEARKLSAVTDK